MLSRESQLAVKRRLDYTWEPFFSRFGRFTEIQERAIPTVLDGASAILCARTASGKTEAVAAPLVERIRRERWSGLAVVYVSPTRALVNDLMKRLEAPCIGAGVTIGIRTGDFPNLDDQNPPSIVITTPESFDSLLTRIPRLFLDVRAVVVDEIHLLDNTPRGDHLRLLLNRLRALRRDASQRGDADGDDVQIVLVSATVHDPNSVARRYAEQPVVVSADGGRSIEARIVPVGGPESVADAILGAASRENRKILAFCRSRRDAEAYTHALKMAEAGPDRQSFGPFDGAIFVHHASLDRKFRLDVERRFAEIPAAVCFATSTLELGIDIGDIDLVVLAGAPYSIGSFLQCIGRGNRRTLRTNALCLSRNEMDTAVFGALLEAAREGALDSLAYAFRPSVLVQQFMSYLRQVPKGELPLDRFELLASASEREALLPEKLLQMLVEHLVREDILARTPRGLLTLGPVGVELRERGISSFANFSGSPGGDVMVADELTGRPVGTMHGRQVEKGDAFLLGGQRLKVTRESERRVDVASDAKDGLVKELSFGFGGAALPFHVAQRMYVRAGYRRDELPAYESEGVWQILHGVGMLYGTVLAAWLDEEFGFKSRSSGMFLRSKHLPPSGVLAPNASDIRKLVERKYRKLLRFVDPGKFANYLPDDVLRKSILDAVEIQALVSAISGRAVVTKARPISLIASGAAG